MQSSSEIRKSISQDDRIVAVMGPTGAGKSTFIEIATRQDGQTVGHGLQSRTADIRAVRIISDNYAHPMVFVDTPGFDDTYKSDTEILSMIADWLVKTYKEKVNLAAILYLHRISDNRMAGSVLKNLQMFASLCGLKAMPNVSLVTTMWGDVREEIGTRRESELKRDFWKEMLASGCRTERFEDTYESAWRIVDSLAQMDRAPVLLSSEIVDTQLRLNETKAGITLNKELEKMVRDRKLAAQRLQEQAESQGNPLVVQELNAQKAQIEKKISQAVVQLRVLKIPFRRQLRLFLKGNRA